MMALGIIEVRRILSRLAANHSTIPTSPVIGRTNSALIVASRIGHQNTVGRLRSGSASLRHGVISPASHCRSR